MLDENTILDIQNIGIKRTKIKKLTNHRPIMKDLLKGVLQ